MNELELLQTKIKAHLKAYTELLSDYEKELKAYLKQDYPESMISLQETLISKTKAKISALEDINQ
jgi:hypothetical protein